MRQRRSNAAVSSRRIALHRATLALIFCLPIPAIADVTFGAMVSQFGYAPFSPGVLVRGGLVFFIIAMALSPFTRLGTKPATLIYLTIACTLPSLFVSIGSNAPLFEDVSHLIKAVFMPFLLAFLVYLIDRYRIGEDAILRMVEVWTYVMTLGFLLPAALGIGFQTYGDYAEGEKGFFVAGNDSSLALALGLFLVSYRLFFVKFSKLRFAIFLLGIYAVISVGSRTGLILTAATGALVFVAVAFFRGRRKSSSVASKLARGAASLALVGATVYATSFGLTMQSTNAYQQAKIENLSSGDHPRSFLISVATQYLDTREPWKNLTGEGSYNYETGVGRVWVYDTQKLAEVDWLDSYGIYGLPFTILVHLLILLVIGVAVKNMLYFRSALSFIVAGASGAYLLHSALAGHALFSPTVSTIFAVCGALILRDRQFRQMGLQPDKAVPRTAVGTLS